MTYSVWFQVELRVWIRSGAAETVQVIKCALRHERLAALIDVG